jgi:quinoprotein relay system zinc metallohydrolase 2
MPRLWRHVLPLCLLWSGAVSAAPLAVTEVAPGVFVHQGVHEEFGEHYHGDIANIGFVIGREAVAVVDTGGSFGVGSALREAIRARTLLPIRYVINTHVHADHVFGNAAFGQDHPVFIGHHGLARAMALRADSYLANIQTMLGDAASGSRLVPPSRVVDKTMQLELGGRTLTLRAWPAAHTDHDLTVSDDVSGSLWLGDLLFVERTPSIDGDIHGWLTVIEELMAMPANLTIPGHGPVTTDKNSLLGKERRYLQALLNDLRSAIRQGKSMTASIETAAQSEKPEWVLFDSVNARNAALLYPALEWE